MEVLPWKASIFGSGPTVDPEGERELESIPLVDEDWVILGPKSEEKAHQIAAGEIVLRSSYFAHEPLCGEGSP